MAPCVAEKRKGNLWVLLLRIGILLELIVASLPLETSTSFSMPGMSTKPICSALARARRMEAPVVSATQGGELEHLDFWTDNEDLFRLAWREWFEQRHRNEKNTRESSEAGGCEGMPGPDLPDLDEFIVIDPNLQEQIRALFSQPTREKEQRLKNDTWQEPIEGVYVLPNFLTNEGIRRVRRHLSAASNAGIPIRRPNGMNRYGLVLDEETEGGVTYSAMDAFRDMLVDNYVRPLGRTFFPNFAGSNTNDLSSAYAFTIHYAPPSVTDSATRNSTTSNRGDQQLKEHSDASVYTMNINLNLPEEVEECEGSTLEFLDQNTEKRSPLKMTPGMAVIHRGLHRHRALPIAAGQRDQLVVWVFGDHGYVRFVPYEKHEQMSVKERWAKSESRNHESSSRFEL